MGERPSPNGTRRRRKKKLVAIEDALGFALGSIGLSLSDFCDLTPTEYAATCKAWNDRKDEIYRDEWERMRLHAAITSQPHVKKKIDVKKLIKFSWEQPKVKAEPMSREEARKRFEKLTKDMK